ncbi:cell division protein FtsL [Marinococcus luteus]|uniref:cell division protein FtsL n=1 Tax=Marinococcus luteus TaxID=1122204 RepID=UPI002ACC8A9D|nr:cell division protein FtsL [Marinococcus luteus]MDZ5781727.1 cell division protein FtsL [Marinococcus luteus]
MENLAQQIKRQQEDKQIVHKKVQYHVRGGITKGEKLIMTAVIIGILIASFFIVSNFATIHAQDQQIDQTATQVQEQQQVNQNLELQVAELSSPERIMDYAKNELDMEMKDENIQVVNGTEQN